MECLLRLNIPSRSLSFARGGILLALSKEDQHSMWMYFQEGSSHACRIKVSVKVTYILDALPDAELMRDYIETVYSGGNELNTTHYRVQFR